MTDIDKPQKLSREKTTARRRRHILDAAVMCFLEQGYHQTGVRDIAKRADVSLGNLYNHFPGKHDVLVEIAMLERNEMKPFLKTLRKSSPAPKILGQFVAAYAKYLAKPENVILSIEITNEALRQPDIATLFLENRQELIDALARMLTRGAVEGDFRVMPSADEGAQLLLSVIEGSAYRSVLGEIPMRKIVSSLKDFVLAAVLVR
ncbi:TetR/AcrR family transcriptional regulator [Roseovarius sp. 2305UL8-3]|uniref:TetR/AcrR family transcriptional regulator n=1 Tax=Roseovarius conchicola TaxID=3121636 RepID=UPI00352808A9